MPEQADKVELLVAEDSEYDFRILKESLEGVEDKFNLIHFKNGEDLYDHVLKTYEAEKCHGELKKRLILLDLNMPRMNGLTFLQKIRDHKEDYLHSLPIIVITTSMYDKELRTAINKGILDFIIKSDKCEGMEQLSSDVKQHLHALTG